MLSKNIANTCPSIFDNSFSNPVFIERLLIIIYTVIFLIGIVGNFMTIIIIKCNTHLRTPTNVYLLNLAVSDLMMLICNLPIEMIEIHYREWPLSIMFCRLRNIFVEFFTCSSILTILAFSCERYFAIVHPMHFHQLNRFHRVKHIIIIIWCLSLLISVPIGFSYEIETNLVMMSSDSTTYFIKTMNDSKLNETISSLNIYCKSCVPKKQFAKLLSIIMIITSICCFYFPMIIIGIIYIFIIKALHHVNKYEKHTIPTELSSTQLASDEIQPKKQTTSSTSCHSIANQKENTIEMKPKSSHIGSYSWLKNRARYQARKVVVKTLVAVVIAFFICYAPLYLQRLLSAIMSLNSNLNSDSYIFSNVMAYLYVISGITFYFGSIINPILYNLVSNKYRRAFRDLCCCRLTFKTRNNFKNQRKCFHPHSQPIHSFGKKLPPDSKKNFNAQLCLDHNNEHPNQTRALPFSINMNPKLSDIQAIPTNSPSIHSYKKEACQTQSLHPNATLPKKNVKYTILRNFPWRESPMVKNSQLT